MFTHYIFRGYEYITNVSALGNVRYVDLRYLQLY